MGCTSSKPEKKSEIIDKEENETLQTASNYTTQVATNRPQEVVEESVKAALSTNLTEEGGSVANSSSRSYDDLPVRAVHYDSGTVEAVAPDAHRDLDVERAGTDDHDDDYFLIDILMTDLISIVEQRVEEESKVSSNIIAVEIEEEPVEEVHNNDQESEEVKVDIIGDTDRKIEVVKVGDEVVKMGDEVGEKQCVAIKIQTNGNAVKIETNEEVSSGPSPSSAHPSRSSSPPSLAATSTHSPSSGGPGCRPHWNTSSSLAPPCRHLTTQPSATAPRCLVCEEVQNRRSALNTELLKPGHRPQPLRHH